MEDKYEEVLAQYPIQYKNKRRVRGAVLLETEDGLRLLRNYNGHRNHLVLEEQIKKYLMEQGYPYVDLAVENGQGELLSRDGLGGLWIMRRWYTGRECDIRDAKEVCQAAAHLGKLHQMLVLPENFLTEEEEKGQIEGKQRSSDAGVVGDQIAASQERELVRDQENAISNEETVEGQVNVTQEEKSARVQSDDSQTSQQSATHTAKRRQEQVYFAKRNRELKRIHTYIRKKRRKNEMELGLLNAFSYYYEQGCEAERIDAEGNIYRSLYQQALQQRQYIHGSYNYHNLLMQGKRIATTSFENAKIGIQVLDLYGFLRKVMEKNGWKCELGMEILEVYRQNRTLSEQECKLLYTLLLYPEKYWKQCNFYYNGKKSWMSVKNYDKLLRLQAQEQDRRQFLETIKGVLF